MKNYKIDLKVFTSGNPENIPIIFIHGFPYDKNMWREQINELSSSYYCVTYDIRGLGDSPAGDGQLTLESFVDDLSSVMENLKLHNPVLCGLSMGGYIALRAVERMEEKFRALILMDTKAEADNNETKLKRAASIKQINEEGVEKFVQIFIPATFREESINKLGKKYNEILNRSKHYDPLGVKGCLLAMAGRTDTTAYLSKIKIPVLVLCGEEDKLTPPGQMKEVAAKIRNSEFYIVPESAHMSPIENPEFVNKRIKEFLRHL